MVDAIKILNEEVKRNITIILTGNIWLYNQHYVVPLHSNYCYNTQQNYIRCTDGSADGCLNFEEMTDKTYAEMDIKIDVDNDIVTLPFSSGTTGLPKGVMLTHKNMVTDYLTFFIFFQYKRNVNRQ